MKYYDLEDMKYHKEQNSDNTRIPFPDGLIQDAYDRVANGESVSIDEIPLNEFFSKEVIEKNLLYIELRRLVRLGENPARQEQIKAILNPVEEEK